MTAPVSAESLAEKPFTITWTVQGGEVERGWGEVPAGVLLKHPAELTEVWFRLGRVDHGGAVTISLHTCPAVWDGRRFVPAPSGSVPLPGCLATADLEDEGTATLKAVGPWRIPEHTFVRCLVSKVDDLFSARRLSVDFSGRWLGDQMTSDSEERGVTVAELDVYKEAAAQLAALVQEWRADRDTLIKYRGYSEPEIELKVAALRVESILLWLAVGLERQAKLSGTVES